MNAKFPMQKFVLLMLFAAVAGGMCASVAAQENRTTGSTVVYPAAFFTEWSPVTVKDMLDRVPGLASPTGGGFGGGGGGGRGLGGGGGDQILIDGKRMAGKDNQATDQLTRISADQVDYIEIIRGTSGELDVRGSSQVINVVLLKTESTSNISYELNVDRYLDHHIQPGGAISYGGQTDRFNYVLSARAEPRYDHYVNKENSRLGDYSPNDLVREERTREQTSYTYSAVLGYDITASSSARLNALYARNDNKVDVERWTTDLRVMPNTVRLELEDIPADQYNWEVGGDYEYHLNNGARFKILFIVNENDRSSIRERFVVTQDGEKAIGLLHKIVNPQLIILDVMMPLKDGFTLAREIREQDQTTPIIFLTAKSMKQDTIRGFEAGGDDYLTKPFSMEELLLRVSAVLRRTQGVQPRAEEPDRYEMGDCTFEPRRQILTTPKGERKLTTKESELLRLLCSHRNEVLERSHALNEVWGNDSYFSGRSMDVYIAKLRKYLREDPKVEIINVHGKGFRLIARDEQ